ncbi:hypothetical protein FSP39_025355 [Pinctada imbricata]|uniref:Potassium channel domain-containing protein n=1 Tax=Pinctada imbricata TaxID=66713 RepID=A0AA88Y7E1_PINIB|nr:hypothetical protein FSP39_025355 [Pinctada imbricata]
MKQYVNQALMFYKHHRVVVTDSEEEHSMTPSPWNFYNSIFFSMTVVSTIGNGRLAPVTFEGRLFVVLYALIGIPLFGIMLMGIGSKIAILMDKLNAKVCCPQRRRIERVLKTSGVVFVGLAFFLCVPAVAIMFIEKWTFGEGFYFSFVTLSTIGFGDFMIGTKEREYQGVYMILSALWILLGLSWVAFMLGEVSHASNGQKDKKNEEKITKSGGEDHGNAPDNVENGNAGTEGVDTEIAEDTKKVFIFFILL